MPRRHRTGRHGEAAGSRRRFAPRIRQDIARKDGVAASFAIIGWICYIAAALLLSWVVGALIHNDMIARTVADVVASAPQPGLQATARQSTIVHANTTAGSMCSSADAFPPTPPVRPARPAKRLTLRT